VAKYAGKVEQTCSMTPTDASAWLQKLPGIGPWTAAEIAVIAWGDADAVSVGDYHLKNVVSFAFTGAPRGTDDEMLALLEPFRPHRARVVRLLHAAGIKAPRFGPRRPLRGRGP
jgi:3-methyladenine DNA glycosylase/8-oxoguanine DNA glycosylase